LQNKKKNPHQPHCFDYNLGFLFNNNYKSTKIFVLQILYNCKSICGVVNIGTPWSCHGMKILKHAKECNGMKNLTQAKECKGMRTRITLG
jgi:hypothetical protein